MNGPTSALADRHCPMVLSVLGPLVTCGVLQPAQEGPMVHDLPRGARRPGEGKGQHFFLNPPIWLHPRYSGLIWGIRADSTQGPIPTQAPGPEVTTPRPTHSEGISWASP